MSWLSLAVGLLGVASKIFEYLDRRNTEDSIKARMYLQGMKEIDAKLVAARKARVDALRDFDAHGVPVDDPNRRD